MVTSVIRWLFVSIVTTAAGLLAIPLVPIAMAFGHRVEGRAPGGYAVRWRLPKWARWLETHDENDGLLPGGLYEPAIKKIYNRFGWIVASIVWLWRNRAYRFTSRFQARVNQDTAAIEHKGRIDVGANGPGLLLVRIQDGGRTYWELYWVVRLFGQRGLRVRLGYKLQPLVREPRDSWPKTSLDWSRSSWAMPALYVWPFAKVSG